jgi:hypothetical protein
MHYEELVRGSLRRDLERRLNVNALIPWIEEEAERLALAGLQKSGRIEFTPELLSRRSVIQIQYLPANNLTSRGRIVPAAIGSGYRIDVRRNLPIAARRMTIAHEIAHTYWFRKGNDGLPLSPDQQSGTDEDIETLCDLFAVALLIPRFSFACFIPHQLEDTCVQMLNRLPELSAHLGVPQRAVGLRILRLLSVGEAAIICSQRAQPRKQLHLMKQPATAVRWWTRWVLFTNAWRKAHLLAGYSLPGFGLRPAPQISADMIPAWAGERASWGNLDDRWGALAFPDQQKQQSTPPRRDASRSIMQGAARLTQRSLYVLLGGLSRPALEDFQGERRQ